MTATDELVVSRVGVTLIELVDLVEATPSDHTWRARGRCRGLDPELFFPGQGEDTKPAKAVCADCPVAATCLAHAIREHECFGVFGGTSEQERRTIRRAVAADRAKRRSDAA